MAIDESSTEKICPECGMAFYCTPANCWCSKLPPIMPVDMEAECLCPECLSAAILKRSSIN